MIASPRFLTGGLAAVAVASAVTMASPSAYAEDGPGRPCGQSAQPALYGTVVHDPVLRAVPAVTHDEWRWQREVTTLELEFSAVVTPAVTEYLWSHTVIDQPAVPAGPGTPEQGHDETVVVTPAVTETLAEYVQQQTGATRWERDGWNGEHADADDGRGWLRTGNTREEVLTPAVTQQVWVVDQPAVPGTPAIDEVAHQETTWATSSPGDGWTGPLDTRTVPAVIDTVWALSAPDGYTATGASRVHDVTVEQTPGTSATAPDGDGWSAIADSRVVVVDVPAHDELVGEGYTEQVLLAPALPASDPCPQAQAGAVAVDGTTVPAVEGPSVTLGPAPKAHGHQAQDQQAQDQQAQASAPATAGVLPATGNPASAWLLATGAGALMAGTVLVRTGRRRRTT